MYPLRDKPLWQRLIAVAICEKLVFLVRAMLEFLFPTMPSDVTDIEDFNASSLRKRLHRLTDVDVETYDYTDVNIDVKRLEVESGDSTDGLLTSSGSTSSDN